MGNKLLIRAYNVGCGDCIYVRIPDARDGFHILIDCGKKGNDELLRAAISHLEQELPKGRTAGTRRLDLIVATHRHEDHIKGFNPDWFEKLEVGSIWLSVAMDPDHPQATGVTGLHEFASQEMRALIESGRELGPDAELLASLYGVSNDVADESLMKTLPKANGIDPAYVHAGMKHDLALPPATSIHILAPEKDVDHFYLGEAVDTSLKELRQTASRLRPAGPTGTLTPAVDPVPTNVSETDFRTLQSRMLSNALAFAAKDSSIQNNLSVVLLIEWRKRRLLFVGDAEWDGEFKEGKANGSWNVMWERHRTKHLKAPIDFLKVGHHGSINATPPRAELRPASRQLAAGSVYTILDTILPVPENGATPTAQAIVSTEREFYDPIPDCKVLVDLAGRVRNTRKYGKSLKQAGIDPRSIWVSTKAKKNQFFERYEKDFLDSAQPMRTDLEFILSRRNFVEVEIEPRA